MTKLTRDMLASGHLMGILVTVPCLAQTPAPWPPSTQLQLVPDLRIDGTAQSLSGITWLAVSPAGVMAVPVPGGAIRFYSPSGSRVGDIGTARGAFTQQPAAWGWLGDTLWTRDRATSMVRLISPANATTRPFTASLWWSADPDLKSV